MFLYRNCKRFTIYKPLTKLYKQLKSEKSQNNNQSATKNKIKYKVLDIAVVVSFKRRAGCRRRFLIWMGMLNDDSVWKLMKVPVYSIIKKQCEC